MDSATQAIMSSAIGTAVSSPPSPATGAMVPAAIHWTKPRMAEPVPGCSGTSAEASAPPLGPTRQRTLPCAEHTRPTRRVKVPSDGCTRSTSQFSAARRTVEGVNNRVEVHEFLTSRRAKITPEQAGLPAAGQRRVPGLRRSEVAALAGMSVEYYAKLERGSLAGVSASVLDAIARSATTSWATSPSRTRAWNCAPSRISP